MNVYVYDSAFDGTTRTVSDPDADNDFACSYNAYTYGDTPLHGDQHDVFVSGGFNWQSGPLGNFYLPAGSPLTDANGQSGNAQAKDIQVQIGDGNSVTLAYFTTDPVDQNCDAGPVDIGYHYVATLSPPRLTTSCMSDEVILQWTFNGLPVTDFKIYRRLSPGGSYDYNSPLATASPDSRLYVDKGSNFQIGQNYCYLVTFDYHDPFTGLFYPANPPAPNTPGYSNESCKQTCPPTPLPPGCTKTNGIDVVFIVDNTSSMSGAGV